MKKLFLILLSVVFITTKIEAVEPSQAPTIGTMAINAYVFGIAGLVVYDYLNTKNPGSYSKNGFFVSFGLDPKMAVNDKAGNLLFHSGYQFSKNEIYLSSECFEAIDYSSAGIGYNRIIIDRKMSMLTGVEYAIIDRQRGEYYHSIGCEILSRYCFNKNISLDLISNLKLRPDISKIYIFSNYLLITIKF